ncbi:GpE family phage tail protein [Acidovorax sp. A79]
MADLALVFHWRPVDMDSMTVADLMEWRERARERHERQE